MKKQVFLLALAGAALVPAVTARAQILPGPFVDWINTWVLWVNAETDPPLPIDETSIDFGPAPIPENFFNPGSDPFFGEIYFRGLHDGSQPGNTDTIVQRSGDPFSPSEPPGTGELRTIDIELVSLRLVSVEPVRVTGTGPDWQVDSFFDVYTELSLSVPSTGQLTAQKTHPNGGTFDSFFDIYIRMTFTHVDDPTRVHVLDTGAMGMPPIRLEFFGAPWVHQVQIPELLFDENSQFHPFVQEDAPGLQQEVPAAATTPPTAEGPIVRHKICLPKPKRVCIYQLDCKAAPAGDLTSCEECPYDCGLYQGSPCPNFTCATGFTTKCVGTDCCLNFTLVECRFPAGEPPVPPITGGCICEDVEGACCQADGTCTLATECTCTGTWMGPGTTCGPVQGCCFGDGSCVDAIAQICCERLGGTSKAGSCSGVLGKCCDANGTCIDSVDELCCDGAWIANSDCLPPEECCFGLSCTMLDPECCAALGGNPGGAGSVCDPVQKCCFDDGNCLNAEPDCCQNAGGMPGGGLCQTPEACCLPDDSCINTDPECCQRIGGTPHFGDCRPLEACCDAFTGACSMVEPRCCADRGDTPQGAGTTCNPTGACCWDGDGDGVVDSCENDVSEECCNDRASGIFHAGENCAPVGACCYDADGDGVNESCTEISLTCCTDLPGGVPHFGDCQPLEACCDAVTGACSMVEPRCCADRGDTPQGAGTDCTPTGACCWDGDGDGIIDSCEDNVSEECCNDRASSAFHAGVNCAPVGACCFDADGDGVNESCTQISETCCSDLPGGTFNGAGSACGGDANGNGIDDACESGGGGSCPLAPGDWCAALPNDCAGAATELCWPRILHYIPGSILPVIDECFCFSDECGPIDIQPIGTPPFDYSVRCLNTCPNPAEPCVLHFNGIPTTSSGMSGSAIPFGVDVTCGCPSTSTDVCPLPPDTGIPDPCANLQFTDCKNGAANDVCLPVVAVITSSGLPVAQTCDCFEPDGDCGPVTINGDVVSCEEVCVPASAGDCVIHVNGVTTNLQSVHFGDVPVGAALTCACSDPPPTDCQPNTSGTDCDPVACPIAGEECRPRCMEFDPTTNTSRVVDCECVGADDCHIEVLPPAQVPVCVGNCPPGQQCVETTTTDPDTGLATICCECVDNVVCEPTPDGLGCEQTVCPDPAQICRPSVIAIDPLTGAARVVECDCIDDDDCHVEFDAAQQPFCTGVCPPGEVCELFTITNADGTLAFTCDCVPFQQECAPNNAKTDCQQVNCPIVGQDPKCRPRAVAWTPGTTAQVLDCDCVSVCDDGTGTGGNCVSCHVELDAAQQPFCDGTCPPGETCTLFGIDTDGDGERDVWSCDCVPVEVECGPDPTQTYCNPVACPGANEVCIPIVIEIDPFNGQVRVIECECVGFGGGDSCHVTYDPAALIPFCEGDCPPGQVCELFGQDVNNDGVNDRFTCDCVDDAGDCGPTPDGMTCQPVTCPDPSQICVPQVIQVIQGIPVVQVCDCIDPNDCHVEYDAAQGPFCVGACPSGQTCELRGADTDGDGDDDTFGCDCVPDIGNICEPNATATGCKDTVCPTPGDICRPVVVTVGPNGQTFVEACDCVTPDDQCHIEFVDTPIGPEPVCVGTCPPGETCTLLGADANGDGIDDTFVCECLPPAGECQPDATGSDCKPTICPVPGEICRPKVLFWVLGTVPVIGECECVSPNDCHIEFDEANQAPVCVGGCPPGETCRLAGEDLDGDGTPDKWECVCVPVTGECGPTDDGTACQTTVCPVVGEICLPSVITLIGGVPIVEACDCVSPNQCHLEFDAANQPVCVGDCPPGEVCRLFTSVSATGEESFRCECIPDQTFCQPAADGQSCSQTVCPVAGEVCVPTHVSCIPGAGCFVTSCECGDPDACHVNLAPPTTSPPVVCEGACPPGTTCVLRGTDTDGDTIKDLFECVCVLKPIVVAVDDTVLKSRFITISRPGGAIAGATSEAIRVRAVIIDGFPAFDGAVEWVGEPADYPEEDISNPGATFKGARLECEPVFRDWSGDGTVQVFGGLLVPSSQYVVQAVDVSCPDLEDENCYSAVATITTGKFGDIVAPFFPEPGLHPDFRDVSAAVAKFLSDPTAPIKARVQMQPNTPFVARPVDFRDVSAVVQAFLGTPYSEVPGLSGPCLCPSTVTCGATACTTNADCGTGFCMDGFCRDACQRCTP